VRRASSWEAAVKAVNSILQDHIGVSTWRERAWAEGPAWQRNAADHVERIVAGLAELDHDGVAMPFSATTLRQIVGTLLDAPVRRRGDAAGAVTIADIAGAVCIDARHVFVVGLNEGVLPAATVDDLLLGRDLPEPATTVVEGPRSMASRAERAWNAILGSDAVVMATFARTDLRRGGQVYPSPLLAGMPVIHHESHAAGLLAAHALTTAERLARSHDPHLHSPRLARRAVALRARLDPRPTEFDGIVGSHPGLQPRDGAWAITAVERQAVCGLGYFGQFVLRVNEETDAAAILSIEPAERGVLVHAVFEKVVTEWLEIEADQRPSWLRDDHLGAMRQRALELLDELAESIGIQHRLGHAAAWRAERAHILRSIDATLEAESVESSQPVAGEHAFSGVVVVGSQFVGKIDRIDLMSDGGLRVTDFKTSAPTSIRNPLDEGRRLQLPLYAIAADHDRIALAGDKHVDPPAATVRYLHVRDGKAVARDVVIDAALVAEFEGYVRRWLDEITAGHFAPRPHLPNGRCLMCCVDSLGVEELAERARLFGDPDVERGDA
ncbi:MAG TPA: PD-(D/E)XK nuclease family protein, partial [Ilumatobacteraceae bacterium]